MDYEIRKASLRDMPNIEAIYANARAFMAERGNPSQWGASRPALARLRQDVAQGNLYVITKEETIHGVFAFILGDDPTYHVIMGGSWHSERPYGTLHRVAGDGSGGIFSAAVDYASRQIDYLRVDTHEKNRPMQNAIARAGFWYCGTILTDDGTPRMAFDRLREQNVSAINV